MPNLRFVAPRLVLGLATLASLASCATIGSMMSPYSETFSCKNSDHGQCIHPQHAYDDAVAGRPSRSDAAVTNDHKMLRSRGGESTSGVDMPKSGHGKATMPQPAYVGYRDSVYRELTRLIEQPVTPMLKPSRAVRTLILPYADRQRPDRLYMPRYVYSLIDQPVWVVGDYLVDPVSAAAKAPVLGQVQDPPHADAPAHTPGADK